MFRLYYIENNKPLMLFTNDELAPCLTFIKLHNYMLQHCVIVSPNNRKITFNFNNELVFEGFN